MIVVRDRILPGRIGSQGQRAAVPNVVDKPEPDFSAGYAILQSQEPLPPYGLDPRFDDPLTRKRIGEVIARGMEQQVSKRYGSWRSARFR